MPREMKGTITQRLILFMSKARFTAAQMYASLRMSEDVRYGSIFSHVRVTSS